MLGNRRLIGSKRDLVGTEKRVLEALSLKGLGRLSNFGCDSCNLKRSKFCKRSTIFDAGCKHCGLPKRLHEITNSNPRCPMSRTPTPPPLL